MSPRVERVRAFWETLSRDSLSRIRDCYARDVHFRDPFNDIRDREALRSILEGMFDKLEAPAFRIVDVIEDAGGAVLEWDFEFRLRSRRAGKSWRIHGVSLLRFDAEGRVASHIDHWDAAGELYAKLPVIGAAVRWLGRRFAG